MTIDSTSFSSEPTGSKTSHYKRASCLRPHPESHSARVTVNHWQLRDLVHTSSSDKNEILYTYEDSIRATDRNTEKVSTVCKFDFHPRCFKEQYGKIVAGGVISSINHNNSSSTMLNGTAFGSLGDGNTGAGATWRGLFSFYSRETKELLSIRLGSYINNNASIHKISNGQYSSYVCNNDKTLYNAVIDNSSITVNDSINLDFPLNHSALSDDQKNLVVVGDCSSIYLLHPNQQDSTNLHSDNIIDTQCDCGFSTSFDSSGLQFATCFQDGTCLIYDTRNTKAGPLKTIHSTRRNTANGAFRCVKYSRGTDDLLLLSEHAGRVHVVDTRDFNNHHVIVLPMQDARNHGVSAPSSSTSLNSLRYNNSSASINPAVFESKVLEYNEILSYESHISNSLRFNATQTPNLSNFHLLNSFDEDCSQSIDTDGDSSDLASSAGSDYPYQRSSVSSSGGQLDCMDNEITGIDWYEDNKGSHIMIGHEYGLINFDIDSWRRRSFPSYQLL